MRIKELGCEAHHRLAPMLRMSGAMPQLPHMSSRRARGHLNHFVRTPKILYVYHAQFLPEQIPIVNIARMQQDVVLLGALSTELSVLSIYLLTYLLTYSMEHSPSEAANRFSASQEIPPHFMEPAGSLPHSQVPTTCSYPVPDRSSPYPHPTS